MKKFNNTLVFTVKDSSDKVEVERLREKVRELFDLLPSILAMWCGSNITDIKVVIDYFDTDEEEN